MARKSSRDLYLMIRRLARSINARTTKRTRYNEVIGSKVMALTQHITLDKIPVIGTIRAFIRGQRVVVGTSTSLAATDDIAFSGRHGILQNATTAGPLIFDYDYDPGIPIVIWGPELQTIFIRRRAALVKRSPRKIHKHSRGAGAVVGYK